MPRSKDKQRTWSALFDHVQKALGSPPDLICRLVGVKEEQSVQCMYLESMVDKKTLDDYVLKSLMAGTFSEVKHPDAAADGFFRELPLSLKLDELAKQTTDALLAGQCVLVDTDRERLYTIDMAAPQQRQVSEPKSESIIRGPHEGFTESIDTNVGLIRKRIRNPFLRIEKLSIGRQTRTTVLLIYLKNLAPERLVEEARRRLSAIETDSVLESAYIEEYIQDRILTPFPTLTNTERPDVASAHLLDGKVAIMIDGTPNMLLAPVTFLEFFSSPEDYYQRADIATFLRWIRLISFFTAVFVPSLFVAATTFHQELIPAQLLISLSAQREGVPFQAFVEVLMMEVVFEIIREAGLRMPRAVGQALSIVGAIVLGQAAVDAGLISAAVVIVVAITGITNFVVPVYSFGMSQRLVRFSFILLAGTMGLFGILCGSLFLAAHLVSLKSFGVPYLTSVAPANIADWQDELFRAPRPWMNGSRLPGFINLLKRRK
ncbi:spore gernimation protein [Paenibacillus sp. 32O-W]|uniref:spore germination protein n=1 Tax=Paenibacillus sp. 32O-W TaxID=1695218 RepID=UPI0007215520|nr:spore germination protein [Paenibacillus sp. 32O-W]ALS28680.1 spore gernimation protein [Paenibacillus sp. 32O-W]